MHRVNQVLPTFGSPRQNDLTRCNLSASNEGSRSVPNLERLEAQLKELVEDSSARRVDEGINVCDAILNLATEASFPLLANALIETGSWLFTAGFTQRAIGLGHRIADTAQRFKHQATHRRALNCLGGQYADVANFPAAMQCLQQAIQIALDIKDSVAEAASLANAVTVMQEMGHYRRAIEMAQLVVKRPDESDVLRGLKLQCASNALFAACRLGDQDASRYFMSEGESHLQYALNPVARLFFEKNRAHYLIDTGDANRASFLMREYIESPRPQENARVKMLVALWVSLCEWGEGNANDARLRLTELAKGTRGSKLYHHLVLQTLIKVYSDSATSEESQVALAFAHELVEFTTRVKRAKFYRQLSKHSALPLEVGLPVQNDVDLQNPFGQVNDWMGVTDIGAILDECRPNLAKHEELTAIHDDMARLRSASLRRDIRTDAVDTAENWAIAAEFFDDETGQHCFRVGHLAGMLAREIGMDETFCVQIEHAARLHDIGKIAINEVILLKPGPLDASEMAAMRLHTEVGAQMLAGSSDPTLKMAAEVARHHHEWWNGGGYPMKLRSRNIPLSARISAFADVYDALTHARAYKAAWSHERALEEIVRLQGVQFDPELLAPFKTVLGRYQTDLAERRFPGLIDMDSNPLISTRRRLMETIAAGSH